MSIPGDVIPELVVNVVAVAGLLWYGRRALRKHRNRTVVVTMLALALVGLWFNLHGDIISGWQEGFRVEKG